MYIYKVKQKQLEVMTNSEKILTASILGTTAFKNGTARIPALDSGLDDLMKGNQVGDPMNKKIMNAWLKNWDYANLRNDN